MGTLCEDVDDDPSNPFWEKSLVFLLSLMCSDSGDIIGAVLDDLLSDPAASQPAIHAFLEKIQSLDRKEGRVVVAALALHMHSRAQRAQS